MNKASTPSWLPNWIDVSAYTDHGDDLRAWAWEFLRRNADYQADYAEWSALPDSEPDENGNSGWTPKYNRTFGEWELMIFFQAAEGLPALDGETVGGYEKRTGQGVITKHLHLMEKWGIDDLADPSSDAAPGLLDDYKVPPYSVEFADSFLDCGPRDKTFGPSYEWMSGRLMYARWPAELDRNVVTFAFDLRLSIDAQIGVAQKALSEAKNLRDSGIDPLPDEKITRGSHHPKSLIGLLRVLDAKSSGATDDEIIDKLYSGKKLQTDTGIEEFDELVRWKEAATTWLRRKVTGAKNLSTDGYLNMMKWDLLPIPEK